MQGAGWSFQKFNRRAQDWAIVGVAAWRRNGDAGVGLVNMGSTPLLRHRASSAALAGGRVGRRRRRAGRRRGTEPPADLNASVEYRDAPRQGAHPPGPRGRARFPEEYGGAGADTLAYILTIEELARVDSSVAITLAAHTSLGTQPIYLFGTEAQKREWLPRFTSGEQLGAFALTEPDAGSDAANTHTRATLDDGAWVIDGAKQFITNAGTDISGVVSITAVTEGPTGIERSRTSSSRTGLPGSTWASPIARWAGTHPTPGRSLSSAVGFRRRTCSASARPGFGSSFEVLDIGRIGLSAMGVGLAQGAFDEALSYAKERRAFGRSISKFQAIQAKASQTCRPRSRRRAPHLQGCLAEGSRAGRSRWGCAGEAEVWACRLARRWTRRCRSTAATAIIEEYPVCRFYRDAKILTIGEGTDEIQRLVIARALGA